MRIHRSNLRSQQHNQGALTTEAMVALAVLAIAFVPLTLGFMADIKACRNCYYQAVAMEAVDGEMEILAAGGWKNFQSGTNAYAVRAESVTNLPAGKFRLIVREDRLRLEWAPDKRGVGGAVAREVKIK